MLGALGFYGLLLYLVNVIQSDDEEDVGAIGQYFLPEHEFVVQRQKFLKNEWCTCTT